jgi:very-short-patch-repair endonuclease
VSGRSGMTLRRSALSKRDVVNVRGMPATSIVRTLGEVCCSLPLIEAVVVLDAALHDRRIRVDQLVDWAERHSGRRGIANLRRVIDLAEPASESPMESRLRMVLVLGGLPRPKAQVPIHDRWGRFVGRPDLYYEDCRLGIEYDGGIHREMLAEDNRRQNRLLSVGMRLLRFTSADVLGNPDAVVAQVRMMLTTANAGSRGLQQVG